VVRKDKNITQRHHTNAPEKKKKKVNIDGGNRFRHKGKLHCEPKRRPVRGRRTQSLGKKKEEGGPQEFNNHNQKKTKEES